jgi:hypothetical protein
MKNNFIYTILFLACTALPASAEDQAVIDANLTGSGFSDPALQDFMETADGYLNSKNTMNVITDFSDLRDSVISAPAPSLKTPPIAAKTTPKALPEERAGLPALPSGHYKVTFAGESGPLGSFVSPMSTSSKKYAREYVLLGVSVGQGSYDKLLVRLEAAGLRFAGEKISYAKKSKKMVILGWAPYANMAKIAKINGVAGVVVEKKSIGMPLKTKVRFTLKVPYQNKPNVFVPEFIKRLTDDGGFDAEAWFRLPQKNAESKFSMFDVTGTLPVDMIGELSRSPFVASVEFNDASL